MHPVRCDGSYINIRRIQQRNMARTWKSQKINHDIPNTRKNIPLKTYLLDVRKIENHRLISNSRFGTGGGTAADKDVLMQRSIPGVCRRITEAFRRTRTASRHIITVAESSVATAPPIGLGALVEVFGRCVAFPLIPTWTAHVSWMLVVTFLGAFLENLGHDGSRH